MPADKNAPYMNAELSVEERVEDLISRMNREEKIGQLSQACKRMYMKSDERKAEFRGLIVKGRIGSRILSDGGFAGNDGAGLSISDINEDQRIAVEESRLGIPLIYGRDIIYGQRTVFPIPIGQAASFNPGLVEEAYTCIAREAAAAGVHWSFSPMMDVARDPRWGRIIEGSGEDPVLASRMAEAAVKGFQGDDPSDPQRIAACAKHYVAYGAAEGGRDYDTAEVSENTLHNIYLRPFKAAVKAGVCTLMSGFQDMGGTPASANRYTLTDILKNEWGFDGFVVSDWGSVEQLRHHGVAADEKEAAEKGFNAGVDMEMTIYTYDRHMNELIEEGKITEERLDDAVRRVLRTKFRIGLFEKPYTEENLWEKVFFTQEHQEKALQLAEESMVCVRNKDNILPLDKEGARIAVVGPFLREKRSHLGSWILDDASDITLNIEEGIKKVVPDADVAFGGSELSDDQSILVQGKCYGGGENPGVIVVCVGESWKRHGEASNIADVSLPPGQNELIEEMGRLGLPMVVVCSSGRPLPMPAAEKYADAIIYTWNAGTSAGEAIARVLFGDAEPGGRLPMTIVKNSSQIPIYYNRKFPGKIGGWEDRYKYYLDQKFGPLYPFGFGLGYTKYELESAKLDKDEITADGAVTVTATVKNTGERKGSTVVQCYIQDPVASTSRPMRELKQFEKIILEPGENKEVTFSLGEEDLSFYGADRTWKVEPGEFRVFVGFDCRAEQAGTFTVTE